MNDPETRYRVKHVDERVTISASVAIEAITIAGGTEATWRAWLNDSPLPSPYDSAGGANYHHLREKTHAAIDEMLRNRALPRKSTGLILATTKGDIDAEVQWIRAFDQVNDAGHSRSPPTLGNEASTFAQELKLAGPVWAASTACSSGLVALIEAAMCLLDGDAQCMVAAGLDVAGDFVRDGFGALKALSPTLCRPFDRNRDGLALGSAGAALLLGTLDAVQRPVCVLSGWGVASDAVHLTAPDRDAGGLIRAMRQALTMARLAPNDIDVLVAHGTGTRYNDAMEAVAIRAVFHGPSGEGEQRHTGRIGERRGPMVTALKGLIGHTLGASGVIETALAACIFAEQRVPPITNLIAPEWDDLDLVTGTPRRAARPIRHIMKVASGFGGLNAAVILSAASGGGEASP